MKFSRFVCVWISAICPLNTLPIIADDASGKKESIPAADRQVLDNLRTKKVDIASLERSTFRNIVEHLQTTMDMRFEIHPGEDIDSRRGGISQNASPEDILELFRLQTGGSGYYVKDGVVHIASQEVTGKQTFWKIYDLKKILTALKDNIGEVGEEALAEFLRRHVARETWKDGVIATDQGELAIKQTGVVHEKIQIYLDALATAARVDDEDTLMERLKKETIHLRLVDSRLGIAVTFPGTIAGVAVVLREHLNMNYATTVNFEDVPLSTALDQMLEPVGGGYYISGDTLCIATKESAQQHAHYVESWKTYLQMVAKPRVIK